MPRGSSSKLTPAFVIVSDTNDDDNLQAETEKHAASDTSLTLVSLGDESSDDESLPSDASKQRRKHMRKGYGNGNGRAKGKGKQKASGVLCKASSASHPVIQNVHLTEEQEPEPEPLAEPVKKNIRMNVSAFPYSEIVKKKAERRAISSSFVVSDDEPYDTFKAQLLVQIDKAFHPSKLEWENYNISYSIKRIQTGLSKLASNEDYTHLVDRAKTAKTPEVSLSIEQRKPKVSIIMDKLYIHIDLYTERKSKVCK